MSLESDFFKRMTPDFSRFPSAGFTHDSSGWHLTSHFMEGFRADLTVTDGGEISGRVIDKDLQEEYLPLRVPSEVGAFVGTVRENYAALLSDLAEKCFYELPFVSPQANRIAAAVRHRWGDTPERTFRRSPDAGVFRNTLSKKWYGIVLPVTKDKLTEKKEESGTQVEILDVKVAPERLDDFLEEPGIYPAWHMNKKNWVAVLLDGTVPDERILGMLEVSRRFSGGKSASRPGGRIDTWLVPANPKYYDIEAAFEQYDEIIWKQSTNVEVGDIAYMYVAAPVSAILFKCVITQTDIPYQHFGTVRIKKVMKIRFLEKYRRDQFPLKVLKQHGVDTVQGCHGMPAEMEQYIREHS